MVTVYPGSSPVPDQLQVPLRLPLWLTEPVEAVMVMLSPRSGSEKVPVLVAVWFSGFVTDELSAVTDGGVLMMRTLSVQAFERSRYPLSLASILPLPSKSTFPAITSYPSNCGWPERVLVLSALLIAPSRFRSTAPLMSLKPTSVSVANVRVFDPVTVAATLRVICVDETIEAIMSPAGMPDAVTYSPTCRSVVLDSPVTAADPLVSVPVRTVVGVSSEPSVEFTVAAQARGGKTEGV